MKFLTKIEFTLYFIKNIIIVEKKFRIILIFSLK